jgi:prepilin-type N-terminal cleavage/methylation domain-containing protein
MKKLKQGFTLIELLVVISIIALLSTLAVVSLNSTRAKSRDAKRITDIKQVQTALELYYAGSSNAYPAATVTLGSTAAECLGSSGFASASATADCGATIYMGQVPNDPGSNNYAYSSAGSTSYAIAFTLEGATGTLASGAHTANEAGIQ